MTPTGPLQPYNRQMAGYCIYKMYLFSNISKALFEQVFSSADRDKDADINPHKRTHNSVSFTAAKSYLIQKEQLQSMTPSLAVNDWRCVFGSVYVCAYIRFWFFWF